MSTYKDAVDYFKSLAISNVDIAHLDQEGKKKFFRMDMTEFYTGTIAQLPPADQGPFMILFNYILDFNKIDCVNQKKQFMFMILQGYEYDNWQAEEDALDLCEQVIKEVVNKIHYDSQTYSENEFLYGGFYYDNIRIVPTDKIRNASGNFIGWQCSFFLNERVSIAINPDKWITPEP